MLNKLRLRLTLICASITTAVLIFMILFALSVTEKELTSRSQLTLQSELSTLTYYLQTNHSISQIWLSQLEHANSLIISIEENHHPLLFKGGYKSITDRSMLINYANSLATTDYHFNFDIHHNLDHTLPSTHFEFRTHNGEHFLAVVASIQPYHTSYELTLLKDMKYEDARIIKMRLIFIGLALLAIIFLSLFSWWFSGKAIHPIEENNRKQKEFIAAASHELRSPLAVIQTSISTLVGHTPDEVNFISTISNECKRLSRLISDLLTLTNIDAHSNWSLSPHDSEIDTLLLEIYDLFYLNAKEKGHELILDLPQAAVPMLFVDNERIKQAIIILLDNALSYTPNGTPITLSLKQLPHHLLIYVIDTGPGINDQYKTQVFDRFYRIDKSRHHKGHYGLGLSIAQEIVLLHHGELILEDTPGGGCTFIITLPFNIRNKKSN